MTLRATPPATPKGRKAWLFLSILIPALASKVSNNGVCPDFGPSPDPSGAREGRAYLTVIGPPPLQFEDPTPPPDLAARPPGGAPPKPSARPASADVLAPKTEAPAARPPTAKSSPAAPPPPSAAAGPSQSPPPILRDDAAPSAQPEDFLPYFQSPGGQAPAPIVPPRSTATYTNDNAQ